MNGSLQLREYPGDLVRLSCGKCGRAGQYQKRNQNPAMSTLVLKHANKTASAPSTGAQTISMY
jgi:hypothetical protein